MPATTYNIGFKDDEAVNNSSRSNYIYKDLSLFFSRNPVTGDVSTVSDVQNIKRAVRNLVLLNTWDKPFHPEIGTNIRGSLFENFTPMTKIFLQRKIEEVLLNYEPRIDLQNVAVDDDQDNNRLVVDIYFYIVGVPGPQKVSTFLERVR